MLGVLAVVVVGVAVMSLAGNKVRESESRLAALKAQEQLAAAQITRLQVYGTFNQLAGDRVNTVRQLAGSRFDWEQSLRDLSRAMPADVTIASIAATVAPGARAGAAASSNSLRAARPVPAIELEGCTRDQDSVARLMARLRGVRGVSRVSLASSVKEDVASSGVSASTEDPVGCGRGSKPKFEVVMFFAAVAGAAAAPAAGSATPVAADATATPVAGASATPAPAGTATPAPTVTPGGQAPVSQEGTK